MNKFLTSVEQALELKLENSSSYDRGYEDATFMSARADYKVIDKGIKLLSERLDFVKCTHHIGKNYILPIYEGDWGALIVYNIEYGTAEEADSRSPKVRSVKSFAVILNKDTLDIYTYEKKGTEYVLEKTSAAKASKRVGQVRLIAPNEYKGDGANPLAEVYISFYHYFLGINKFLETNTSGNPLNTISAYSVTGPRVKRDFFQFARSKGFNKKVHPKIKKFESIRRRNDDEFLRDLYKNHLTENPEVYFASTVETQEGELLITYFSVSDLEFRVGEKELGANVAEVVPLEEYQVAHFGAHIDVDGTLTEFRLRNDGRVYTQKVTDYAAIVLATTKHVNDITVSPLMKWKKDIIDHVDLKLSEYEEYEEHLYYSSSSRSYSYALLELSADQTLEQLYRTGFQDIVLTQLTQKLNKWKAAAKAPFDMETFFGPMDHKQKKLNNKLGLNKSQIKFFKENLSKSIYAPGVYKYILGDENDKFSKINTISQQEFDLVTEILTEDVKHLTYDNHQKNGESLTKLLKMIHDKQGIHGLEFAKRYLSETHYSSSLIGHLLSYYQLYEDTHHLLDDDYKINISSFSDLNARISELTYLAEYARSEEERKKFAKSASKLKKYESENDEYIILAPREASELVDEGSSLRHCVASYVSKVADGKSNILFVRRKEDPETPLYTLEVSKTGDRIVQLRGHSNSDPVPEARAFVEKALSDVSAVKNS